MLVASACVDEVGVSSSDQLYDDDDNNNTRCGVGHGHGHMAAIFRRRCSVMYSVTVAVAVSVRCFARVGYAQASRFVNCRSQEELQRWLVTQQRGRASHA